MSSVPTYINPLTLENRDVAFKTTSVVAYIKSNFASLFCSMHNKILFEESQFVTNDFGLTLLGIDGPLLRTNELDLLGGGTYIYEIT